MKNNIFMSLADVAFILLFLFILGKGTGNKKHIMEQTLRNPMKIQDIKEPVILYKETMTSWHTSFQWEYFQNGKELPGTFSDFINDIKNKRITTIIIKAKPEDFYINVDSLVNMCIDAGYKNVKLALWETKQ